MKTIMLTDGTVYTLAPHAVQRMQDREITESMIVEVIENPERTVKDLGGNDKHYRVITTNDDIVRRIIVVVDETEGKIITVMEDYEFM